MTDEWTYYEKNGRKYRWLKLNGPISGYLVRYFRYYVLKERVYDTLNEALDFLNWGNDYGELASEAIIYPDGTVLTGRELDEAEYARADALSRGVHE